MKYLRKLKRIIDSIVGDFINYYYKNKLNYLPENEYLLSYKVPSYTQWESRELVEKIVKEDLSAKDDPLWQNSGAESREEYEMYSWQSCGMTCLKMILASMDPKNIHPIIKLAKDAEGYGAYIKNNKTDPRFNLDGMYHKPFVGFIKKFGLNGKIVKAVREHCLANLIIKNCFIIASVHHTIRDSNIQRNTKCGHLILVTGFKKESSSISGFFINNPSGFKHSQEKYFVSIGNWNNIFSGNIIIINKVK
jgi:hypothetical protein